MPIETSRDVPLKAEEAKNNGLNNEAKQMIENQQKNYNEYMKIKQELAQKNAVKHAEKDLNIKKQNEIDIDL